MKTVSYWQSVIVPTGEVGKVVEAYYDKGVAMAIVRVDSKNLPPMPVADLRESDTPAVTRFVWSSRWQDRERPRFISFHYRHSDPTCWQGDSYSGRAGLGRY